MTADLHAALVRIGALRDERDRIDTAKNAAETDLCNQLGMLHRQGVLTLADLDHWYREISDAAAVTSSPYGLVKRWHRGVGMTIQTIRHRLRDQPNGPAGTWSGWATPTNHDPVPTRGTHVVYYLYDEHGHLCYIGATSDLRARLRGHRTIGRKFTSWTALSYPSRDTALAAESIAIHTHRPHMNVQIGR